MNKFLRGVLASIIGFLIGGVLLILLFFGISMAIISGLESSYDDKEVSVKDNSVLHIKMNAEFVDRESNDPFNNLDFGPFKGESTVGLNTFLKTLKNAADDERIKGIFIELESFPGGLATLEEVRNALIDFKDSGKWIVTYSESMSQGALYVSSVADRSYVYPEGDVLFTGLSTTLAYVKGLFEKMDFEMQAIRGPNNKYKSAVEPLIADEMSESNREQITAYLNSIWGQWLDGLSEKKGISRDELQGLANNLDIRSAKLAAEHGLVDDVKYRDEVIAELMEKVDVEDEDDLEMISFGKYKNYKPKRSGDRPKEKIAVIYASGSIESGKSDDGTMGSETIAEAIKKARQDSTVKAIVMRVNSPGGSALASDVMWRETILAKENKPFIVSMGDVAASGGYYIACAADKIYAQETTITGSIGVFGLFPTTEKFFNNKLGIKFYSVNTNDHSDMFNGIDRFDDVEYQAIDTVIKEIYYDFISKVAEGRGMTKEAVDEVAKGRVWTGTDALKVGLVDELGGLDDAIAFAAEQAGIENYTIKELPSQKDPIKELFAELGNKSSMYVAKSVLGEEYKYFNWIEQTKKMTGVQARLPYLIEFNY